MLEITKLYKTYENSQDPILKGIYLHLSPGDFCVIIGSNGSGKSTLFKAITDEINIDSGNIKKNSHVSIVTQNINSGTIPEMTMLENIVLSKLSLKNPGFRFYKNYRNQIISEIRELNLGFEKFIDTPLNSLSGGQRQIIATFMALNSGSKIILLDEHTSALDPKSQKILMGYTAKAVKDYKLTALMITHKLEDAHKYGNRLIMMHNGKIIHQLNEEEKNITSVEQLNNLFYQSSHSI